MKAILERRRALLLSAHLEAAVTTAAGPHSISEVRGFQVSPSPSRAAYALLRIQTNSGLIGYGECKALSASDLKAASEVAAGHPASAYEVLGELVPPNMRAGLNMALLDILGKAVNAPVYRVLGGPTRNKARAITRLSGSSDEELQRDLEKQHASGFHAFLVPIPAPLARNQGSAYIYAGVARLKALRDSMPDADFALEAAAQLTPSDAASLAAALEPMHPLWLDQPCAISNLSTIGKIGDETVMPLGFGRDISEPAVFQDLLRNGLIDLLRPNLLTHGITGIQNLAAMAETYYVDVAPWHDGGPVATAAALHAAASIPNFFIVQMPGSENQVKLRDGFYELPKAPGLGVEIDEKDVERNRIL